jgi:hypothetical protein
MVQMYPRPITTLAACFVCLILLTSGAPAQTAPNTPEMATGDIWPSRREQPVYVPREALELPDAADTSGPEMVTGDVWPTSKPREDVMQGRPMDNAIQKKTPDRASR